MGEVTGDIQKYYVVSSVRGMEFPFLRRYERGIMVSPTPNYSTGVDLTEQS